MFSLYGINIPIFSIITVLNLIKMQILFYGYYGYTIIACKVSLATIGVCVFCASALVGALFLCK